MDELDILLKMSVLMHRLRSGVSHEVDYGSSAMGPETEAHAPSLKVFPESGETGEYLKLGFVDRDVRRLDDFTAVFLHGFSLLLS